MPVRRTLRRRFAISPILLAALVFVASAITLHAQAASKAISAIQPVTQQDRIPAHPNFAPLTQLSNQLPGWVHGRPQSSVHAVDLSTTIHVSLVLNRDPAVEAAFDKLLADQQTPGSPLYHQWLTPQQLGSLYGPTANDLAALTIWLTSQGLKLDSIAPNGVIVHASGSAAVVGNAFHTTFAMFDPDEGLTAAPRLSAVSEPSIPSVLTPLVRSIQGLGEIEIRPLNQARPMQGTPRPAGSSPSTAVQPLFTNGTDHFITPGDFGVIFDINSVYHVGNTGATIGSTPQRIAVIGESRVVNTDITEFEQLVGLTSYTPTVVIPTGAIDPGTTSNSIQGEATLDVDRVIGTAPGAGVDLVVAGGNNGLFTAIEWNINNLLDPVMTISFGGCETQNGAGNTNSVDTLAKAAAAEGITILVSSGDSGAAGCDISFSQAPAVQTASINFICSSTYVTCVGGTEFNDATGTYWGANSNTFVSALSYIPEGGWNEPSNQNPNTGVVTYAPAASGGGVSIFIAKPTWQTVTGVPAGNFRFVPDVSFPAAAHDGYFACLAYNGGDCATQHFEVFSGTSAAAPGMAGVVALVNTKLGTAVGNINPLLYQIATSTPSAFHDTTVVTSGVTGCTAATPSMCNSSTPGPTTLTGGLAGFLLTAGYDEVTGLGSLDVNNLITAAATTTTTAASTTLVITPPVAITAGQSTTFTATLTPAAGSTGTPTGTVQFYSNGTAIGAAATLTNNSATSPSQAFSTAGTYTITAIYSGDALFATSTAPAVSLVVNAAAPAGSFTLAVSPATLSGTPTASTNGTPVIGTVTSTITVASTNSFNNPVALTCAVTPTATLTPTCAISPTSVIPAPNDTVPSTLTISFQGQTSNCVTNARATPSVHMAFFGPMAVALLLLLLPFRKRRSMRNLACILLLAAGLASLSGCGGNSTTGGGGGGACSNVISAGTTPGSYTVTVTGASASITQTATVALTIN